FRCFKASLIKLFENIDVIARINVIADYFAIIDDFHESIALLALRYAFGEAGHHLSIGAIEGVIFEQRFAQYARLGMRIFDWHVRRETQLHDDFVDQRRWIPSKGA